MSLNIPVRRFAIVVQAGETFRHSVLDTVQKMMDAESGAAILQAEGVKQAAILQAEGNKQAQVLAAEGRLAAAQKDAEARERLAQAEAKATELVSSAVSGGNVQALNYFIAQKYVDAMTQIGASVNSKLVLLPLEVSGLVGTIAGIAEIAKNSVVEGAPGR